MADRSDTNRTKFQPAARRASYGQCAFGMTRHALLVLLPRNGAIFGQSGSQPAAAKQLAHSSGVKASTMQPMVFLRSSIVRATALRSMAFGLARAFPNGLSSGLSGGT